MSYVFSLNSLADREDRESLYEAPSLRHLVGQIEVDLRPMDHCRRFAGAVLPYSGRNGDGIRTAP